jgi:DNA helicase-2/ATP-dependent DNA helicase PcrA
MASPAIFDDLNPTQRSAVTSPASVVQVLAPPGSGKTKTLTSRVAFLLSHYGYKPWNILCLTFTIKSAKEMRERIAKLVGNGLEYKLILGTFHSCCRRYLYTYGHLIGVRKGFGIADSSDSQAIITRIAKRLKLVIDPKAARSRISRCKARNVGYEELAAEARQKKNMDQQEFVTVFEAYEAHLLASGLLDYDDLLLRCLDLLKQHPACVANVEAVLVDEFQDTNVVQFELMNLFASKNKRITTVGDPDQSIYGWRSAEIKNLRRMQMAYPETHVIHLEENYRSSGAILLAALEVIEQDESRPQKPLLPTHCPGTVPVLRKLPSSYCEAAWIVSEIKRCIGVTGHLFTFSDFAILLRSVSLSRIIETAMGKAGMPYRMVGGLRFFDRAEIKILLDYLRVISQPNNSDAFARIINTPPRRIGDVTIKALFEEAASRNLTLWSLTQKIVQGNLISWTKVSKGAAQGLGTLVNIIMTLRSKMLDAENYLFPDQVVEQVIKKTDFEGYLKKAYPDDHEQRLANVEELITQASEFSIADATASYRDEDALPQLDDVEQYSGNEAEHALSKFLANVALSTETHREDDTNDSNAKDKITISTIHAAKGLEWPVVFVPAAYDGSIPHSRAEDTNEERRLLYVAMTRARSLLYLSCPTRNSKDDNATLSPFLSTKQVQAYLVDKGPSFTSEAIDSLCRILLRHRPSDQRIQDGIATVQSTEDNMWSLNGDEDSEARQSRWNIADNDSLAGVKRTYTTASARLESSTTYPHVGSFTSAALQLQNTRDNTSQNPNKKFKFLEVDASISDPSRPKANDLKTVRGRGDLRTYWGSGGPLQSPNPVITSTSVVALSPAREHIGFHADCKWTGKTLFSKSNLSEHSTRNPMPTIPRPLASHSISRQRNIVRPKQVPKDDPDEDPYTFISSSPPRTEIEAAAQHNTEKWADSSVKEQDVPATVQGSNTTITTYPLATFHNTSMVQLQARADAPRRTLGVRRTMVGWSCQGNQAFSVPRKADMKAKDKRKEARRADIVDCVVGQ